MPNPDVTYDYYYNESWQVLEVQKGGSANPYEQYVWGIQYVDAPVVRFYDANLDGDVADQGDSTLYYTYDGNFNVTALVKADGTVAERYTYDPYGQVTFKAADWSDAANQSKSAYDNEILYCGYRWDPESGLYPVRRRPYHPTLGRWLTPDPIGYGDGMNLYQYVGSRPVRYIDISGQAGLDLSSMPSMPPSWDPPTDPSTPNYEMPPSPLPKSIKDCPHRKPKPGHKPRYNGCGPEGGISVPNSFFWIVDFTPACNTHDICYGTCNNDKGMCDRAFLSDMSGACLSLWWSPYAMNLCMQQAETYYLAVLAFGSGPYWDAQEEACICGCDGE